MSRGSTSSSVRLLESFRIIKRVAKPGDRQDYFQIAENAFAMLVETSAMRARSAGKEIAATLNELPESEKGTKERLKTFANFYDAVDVALTEAGKRMTN